MSETDYKSGWNTRFESGTYRGTLYGVVCEIIRNKLCHCSRQRACQQTCVNFSVEHKKQYRIDATTAASQRRTGEPTFVVPCPSGCKEFFHKGSKERTVRQVNVQDSWHRSNRASYAATGPNFMFSTTHGSQGESNLHTKKIHRVDRETYIDSALREIYDVYMEAGSAQLHVPNDARITGREQLTHEKDTSRRSWNLH